MTRVLVIDDHPIVFQGCRRLLADLGVGDIVERRCRAGGYRSFLRQRPDMVVTDLTFVEDDLGGLALIERMLATDPSAAIMVFSMHDDPSIVSRALVLGAKGYALKDTAAESLAAAFRTVLSGAVHIDQQLAVSIALSYGRRDRPSIVSTRESQILDLLGKGYSHDRIAERLGISYKTVSNATSALRIKLGLGSFAELVRYALDPSPPPNSDGV